jgi:hypothetical protein
MNRIACWITTVFSITILLGNQLKAQESNFQEKKVGNVYHVSIPDYMTKSYRLNDAASLQYLNKMLAWTIEDHKDMYLADFKQIADSFREGSF